MKKYLILKKDVNRKQYQQIFSHLLAAKHELKWEGFEIPMVEAPQILNNLSDLHDLEVFLENKKTEAAEETPEIEIIESTDDTEIEVEEAQEVVITEEDLEALVEETTEEEFKPMMLDTLWEVKDSGNYLKLEEVKDGFDMDRFLSDIGIRTRNIQVL